MNREFVMLPRFDLRWEQMGLNDEHLRQLQNQLMKNPDIGVVVQGTSGMRKYRIQIENNKGKSGGARVCYVDIAVKEKIYLITAYPKSAQDNLSKEARNIIKELVIRLKEE